MKIAIITSRYPSLDNPYNHMFVHMRSKEFVKQGKNVDVFVPSREKHEYIFEGISVRKISSHQIVKVLRDYDILYLHLLHIYPLTQKDGWIIYKAIIENNLPCVMYVHGSEVQKYSSRPFDIDNSFLGILKRIKKDFLLVYFMKKFVKSHLMNKSLFFLFPSLWMKKEMEKNLSVKISNFEIIPNGIETNLFKFSNLFYNRYKLVSLRPLSSMKYAVDIAIETLRLLPQKYTLHIFGKGKYEKDFKVLINKYSLDDRVTIYNTFINKHEMPDYFSKYGVSLSTSRMDAQGVSMCEAMSSGLLTVSNNNTAIPEFISDMESGILGNSPAELAQKIVAVTSDKKLFEKITKKGRERMQEIDIKVTCMHELKILKDIAEK